jgi:hypothetical protein
MFHILLQIRSYVSKQVSSWLLLEPNFMFLQLNWQVSKKLFMYFLGSYLSFINDNVISNVFDSMFLNVFFLIYVYMSIFVRFMLLT